MLTWAACGSDSETTAAIISYKKLAVPRTSLKMVGDRVFGVASAHIGINDLPPAVYQRIVYLCFKETFFKTYLLN